MCSKHPINTNTEYKGQYKKNKSKIDNDWIYLVDEDKNKNLIRSIEYVYNNK